MEQGMVEFEAYEGYLEVAVSFMMFWDDPSLG